MLEPFKKGSTEQELALKRVFFRRQAEELHGHERPDADAVPELEKKVASVPRSNSRPAKTSKRNGRSRRSKCRWLRSPSPAPSQKSTRPSRLPFVTCSKATEVVRRKPQRGKRKRKAGRKNS